MSSRAEVKPIPPIPQRCDFCNGPFSITEDSLPACLLRVRTDTPMDDHIIQSWFWTCDSCYDQRCIVECFHKGHPNPYGDDFRTSTLQLSDDAYAEWLSRITNQNEDGNVPTT